MKIGILTFHRAHNFGAVLQAFALQQKLKEYDYHVEIIDYSPNYITKPYNFISLKAIKANNFKINILNFSYFLLFAKSYFKRRKKFNEFIKTNLTLSNNVVSTIPKNYDAYIFGSDQIWNPNISNGFDRIFFGNFETNLDAKKIVYATSIGNYKIKNEDFDYLNNALKNFDYISVREKEIISYFQPLTDKKIETVLDPTLLFDSQFWSKTIVIPQVKEKYILVYQVRINDQFNKLAYEVARELKYKIIEIPAWFRFSYFNNDYISSSPDEFLGLIKNAEYVITSSFHGTVFSVIFNKPFFFINLNDGSEERSINLLESLGLSNRIISKNSIIDFDDINYDLVNEKISRLRKKSIEFLINSLVCK